MLFGVVTEVPALWNPFSHFFGQIYAICSALKSATTMRLKSIFCGTLIMSKSRNFGLKILIYNLACNFAHAPMMFAALQTKSIVFAYSLITFESG